MDKKYSPQHIEDSLFDFWVKEKLFVPFKEDHDKEPYSVLMPPPNITNVLHLGHALNNTVQDVMVRYHRMMGKKVVWKIGVDHAGIATQNMVEKSLLKDGITKEQLGRDAFLDKVWDWKNQYGMLIVNQLQKLGMSADWENLRFTMDDVSSKAVEDIFIKLYQDNLIYKSEYIVNWCPHCLTALSDEEVESKEHPGKLYYVKYFLEESQDFILVATTRPETIFGDVALAVHPDDERFSKWIGKSVVVPALDRSIPIIADRSVERDFGTGALKITPAHDVLDFEIGNKNNLPSLICLDEKGNMNSLSGIYEGKDRFEVRDLFALELEDKGFIEKIEDHQHNRGVCYRCSTVVEPRVSKQWFVKMESLAKQGLQAFYDKKVNFTPAKWGKVYEHWLLNIKDWCISRQIWWGHSIPAYECEECGHIMVSKTPLLSCDSCGSKSLKKETDVLDTWFSSWLWPLTVFEWPLKEDQLKEFYSTQFLATAPEIIFFWVARMIMLGLYVKDEVPFKDVFFNSTICDMKGRKMSKSLGNGIDPLKIIDLYGADALRFTLLYIAPKGERIRLDEKSFELGYRLVNKMWNASRFILMMDIEAKADSNLKNLKLDLWDDFILKALEKTVQLSHKALAEFDYHQLTHVLYHFFWNDFCDQYLESSKVKLYGSNEEEKMEKYTVLNFVLKEMVKLFHPIMPFITDFIWQQIKKNKEISLMRTPYPTDVVDKSLLSKDSILFDKVTGFIYSVRNTRSDLNIPLDHSLNLHVYTKDESVKKTLRDNEKEIFLLSKSQSLNFIENKEKENSITIIQSDYTLFIDFPEGFNKDQQIAKLKKELVSIEKEIKRAQNNLENKKFLENAAKELILIEQKKEQDYKEKLKRLKEFLSQITVG